MRILVVAPHPDDEVIGCGGSILKHRRQGHTVTIAWVTSGDAGGRRPKAELARVREAESRAAAKMLGVKDLLFLGYPDGYMDVTPEALIRGINLIRAKRPDVVYLPHRSDATRDHLMTHQWMMECLRRAGGDLFPECPGEPWSVNTILGYEVWTPLADPTYVEDVTSVMTRKLQALRCHRSQIGLTRYDEAVQGLNRYRGAMTGKGNYCECFEVLRTASVFPAR